MYYENYIIIEIPIPDFEEIKKKYFDSDGNKLVPLNNEFQLESPFEYFTPVMMSDENGHTPWDEFWNVFVNWWDDNWEYVVGGIVSTAEIIGGLALTFTGCGTGIGLAMIATGIGSLLNGAINENIGGSFMAGYLGGQASGLLSLIPGIGGIIGGITGSIITDIMDGHEINVRNCFIAGVSGFAFGLIPGACSTVMGKQLSYSLAFISMSYSGIMSVMSSMISLILGKEK